MNTELTTEQIQQIIRDAKNDFEYDNPNNLSEEDMLVQIAYQWGFEAGRKSERDYL